VDRVYVPVRLANLLKLFSLQRRVCVVIVHQAAARDSARRILRKYVLLISGDCDIYCPEIFTSPEVQDRARNQQYIFVLLYDQQKYKFHKYLFAFSLPTN